MSSANLSPTARDHMLRELRQTLGDSSIPDTLKERLLRDADGGPHYRRLPSIGELTVRAPNSSYLGFKLAGCACRETVLVSQGNVALLMHHGVGEFLGPGYHSLPIFGEEVGAHISVSSLNVAVRCATVGFITITDGHVGVMQLGSEFRLLAPGSYEWNSPVVGVIKPVSIRSSASQLGPFSLVTVTEGTVAVTYHHGSLRILGWTPDDNTAAVPPQTRDADSGVGKKATPAAAAHSNSSSNSRTYFMNDPNWVHQSFLSTQMQTDRLEDNDLLSKDNVELVMVAMSQWRIVNPSLAITQCGSDMNTISKKVDQLVRATIARIVAGTRIGGGPVSGHMTRKIVQPQGGRDPDSSSSRSPTVATADADMAHLMQSSQATAYMAELTHNMQLMGIEVVGVYVPEKRMKNDDTRSEIAKQAVIGIQAEAKRSAADAKSYSTIKAAQAEAEADRSRADAKAYVTTTVARAEAVAIGELAVAHSKAGEQLGAPTTTAARLALSETVGKIMEGAQVTIFSGAPSTMPYLLTSGV